MLCVGVPEAATALAAVLQVLPVLGEDVVAVVACAARPPAPVGVKDGVVVKIDVVVIARAYRVPQIPQQACDRALDADATGVAR